MTVFTIEVLRGPVTGRGHGWSEGGTALVELPGLDEPRTLPAQRVPSWLAALVGLGPRPVPAARGILLTDAWRLRKLLDEQDGASAAVTAILDLPDLPPAWTEALGRLRAHLTAHWRLTVDALGLEVIDGATAGLWRLAGDPDDQRRVVLQTTTPTQIWRCLTLLVTPQPLEVEPTKRQQPRWRTAEPRRTVRTPAGRDRHLWS
jgi:hypothetical protein